jgi:threonine/homoserine/homoserine lactone efflux protein
MGVSMFNESVIAVLSMIGLVHFVALISPGPDFAMILRTSVQNGKRYAMWAALGLGFGVLFHVTYCLLGLSLLIKAAPYAMRLIATAGSCYLLYQGYKSLVYAFKTKHREPHLSADTAADHKIANISILSAVGNGFFTNVLNPKVVAYFLSFFAAAISNIESPYLSTAAGAEVFLLTWVWFTFVAQVVSSGNLLKIMRRYDFYINLLIGISFILFAISMLLFAYL